MLGLKPSVSLTLLHLSFISNCRGNIIILILKSIKLNFRELSLQVWARIQTKLDAEAIKSIVLRMCGCLGYVIQSQNDNYHALSICIKAERGQNLFGDAVNIY